jgi:hypothetical protein
VLEVLEVLALASVPLVSVLPVTVEQDEAWVQARV